jgi:hypothetical protein
MGWRSWIIITSMVGRKSKQEALDCPANASGPCFCLQPGNRSTFRFAGISRKAILFLQYYYFHHCRLCCWVCLRFIVPHYGDFHTLASIFRIYGTINPEIKRSGQHFSTPDQE